MGILTKNQQQKFPLIPKRIAVISADSSKGLSDFMDVLNNNDEGYQFFTYLFPAYLQGDIAVDSIIQTLHKIERVKYHFDIVVIVRGGGAEVSMTCYNHFELCKAIAEFPLPVLTGIGHSTNLTVAEMISFRNAITPTKLAEFLIQTYREFDQQIKDLQTQLFSISRNNLQLASNDFESILRVFKTVANSFVDQANMLLENQKNRLSRSSLQIFEKQESQLNQIRVSFGYLAKSNLNKQESQLNEQRLQLSQQIHRKFERSEKEIHFLENTVKMLDPFQVLKRGFSMTTFNGFTIDLDNFPTNGDQISTTTSFGTIESTVEKTELNK
jgi:exodeoxyribonuclease VII large subunit